MSGKPTVTVLSNLPGGHCAGLPTGYPGHIHLSFHECDDDCLGRRVPLFYGHHTGRCRRAQHGRPR